MLSSCCQTVFRSLGDQAALKMRDGSEDVEYEFASGRCRVDPLLKADQVDLSGLEIIDGFQQLLERAPQSIKADNGEDGV